MDKIYSFMNRNKIYEYPNRRIKIEVNENIVGFFESAYTLTETDVSVVIRNRDTNELCALIFHDSLIRITEYFLKDLNKVLAIVAENDSFIKVYSDFVTIAQKTSSAQIYNRVICYAYSEARVQGNNDSIIYIHGSANAVSHNRTKVTAFGTSTVLAYDNSEIILYDDSLADCIQESRVQAYDESTVKCSGESVIFAYNNSIVKAYDYVIFAYNNSIVKAYGCPTVEANNFSTIYQNSTNIKLTRKNHFGLVLGQVFTVEEDMIVYKKLQGQRIASLLLTKGQTFQSKTKNKCRTDKAVVLEIKSLDGSTDYKTGISFQDSGFIYNVGETVYPKEPYCTDIDECASGIHFFLTRKEAEDY